MSACWAQAFAFWSADYPSAGAQKHLVLERRRICGLAGARKHLHSEQPTLSAPIGELHTDMLVDVARHAFSQVTVGGLDNRVEPAPITPQLEQMMPARPVLIAEPFEGRTHCGGAKVGRALWASDHRAAGTDGGNTRVPRVPPISGDAR